MIADAESRGAVLDVTIDLTVHAANPEVVDILKRVELSVGHPPRMVSRGYTLRVEASGRFLRVLADQPECRDIRVFPPLEAPRPETSLALT